MKRIEFASDGARAVDEYDSHGALWSPLPSTGGPTRIGVMCYEAGAVLGRHPASIDQLFVVVSGFGWGQTGDGPRETVTEGMAVLWARGEIHESGSDEGMTAVILQAESFDWNN